MYVCISTVLAGTTGRAFGGVISKFKALKNIGYNTFFKMNHLYVVPIMDYGSGMTIQKLVTKFNLKP